MAFFIYVGNYIKSVFLVWTFKNYMQIVKWQEIKILLHGYDWLLLLSEQ